MPAIACRSCRAEEGSVVLDLGLQPACEYFPPLDDPSPDPTFPLRLWLCDTCGLAQLADDADLPDQPEGLEPAALAEQRRDAVATAHAAGLLPAGATVIEGATPHGGSWWAELAARGLRPAEPGTPADVVVDGTFGLMHATDQRAALAALVDGLAPGGVLLFQFHTLAAIVAERQWNAIRLGHYAYYSLPTVQHMLASVGLGATHAWTFPLYGGTVLVAARRGGTPGPSVTATMAEEIATGVLDPAAVGELQDAVDTSTASLQRFVRDAAAGGRRVYAYSAASRAVSLLHLAGIGPDRLLGVADASPAKQGCRMPGTAVPVIAPRDLVAARPDAVLMFVSDLLPEVRRSLPAIEESGGRWIDTGSGEPTEVAATFGDQTL